MTIVEVEAKQFLGEAKSLRSCHHITQVLDQVEGVSEFLLLDLMVLLYQLCLLLLV